MQRYSTAALALAVVLALATLSPLEAQTSRREPARREPVRREPSQSEAAAAAPNLKMRETGIQGEQQRPDVLFVIPSGRRGPIVSPRLRDYSFDIQEPVVKPWLDAESRIAVQVVARREGSVPDWREAVQAAAKAPVPAAPVPMPEMRTSGARQTEPGIPREALPSGPRVVQPGIPRAAMQSAPRMREPSIPREAMQLPPR